jgi:hypothetical protein
VHTKLSQSSGAAQSWPALHGAHEPPQSTSVSLPLLTPSEQLGGWHCPPPHTLLVQSLPAVHVCPTAQSPQAAPPQSTSVSVPFFTPSVHVALWQTLPVHTLLLQSFATRHA